MEINNGNYPYRTELLNSVYDGETFKLILAYRLESIFEQTQKIIIGSQIKVNYKGPNFLITTRTNREVMDGEIRKIMAFEAGYRDFGERFNYSSIVKETLCQKLIEYRDHICLLCLERNIGLKVENSSTYKSNPKGSSIYKIESNCKEIIKEIVAADK